MPAKKTPFMSVLEDREIMEELRARMGTPGMRARAGRFNVPPEAMMEAMDRAPALGAPVAIEEAIILDFGRPALLVQNDTFEDPESEVWKTRLLPNRSRINAAIRAVGRVEVLGHPTFDWLGTAWMVSDRIAVTNRHVASLFAARKGNAFVFLSNPLGDPIQARVDFKEEFVAPGSEPRENEMEIAVGEVAHIEELGSEFPDLALLKLSTTEGALPPPLVLKTNAAASPFVAVIGYPAFDSRNAVDSLDRVFGDIYNVKRFAPGMISTFDHAMIFTHDCSTLGGNSGSVVIDVQDGAALGLHFGGVFHDTNYAVKAKVVESRLMDLDITVPIPGPPPEEPGEVEVEVREVSDYADREGYKEDFLGSDFKVPLPALSSEIEDQAAVLGNGENELKYTHFSLVMNRERRLAFYTACNIDGKDLRRFPRGTDSWYTDPRLGEEFQADNFLYKNNDLDRGHLVRRLDPIWGSTAEAEKAQDDTFHYTNAAPQHKDLNQKIWVDLEDYILDNTEVNDLKVSVLTGPVFSPGDHTYRGVKIPREFWKVITMVKEDEQKLSATAYLLSQADMVDDFREFVFGEYKTYQVALSLLEEKTGLRFGSLKQFDPLEGLEAVRGRGRSRVLRDVGEVVV